MAKASQPELFSADQALPEGWIYRADFISVQEEQDLLAELRAVQFSEIKMHGVVARRRIAEFGLNYEFESWHVREGEPIPEWLLSLRARLSELTVAPPQDFVEVLLTEYQPGAGIGWHRDARAFGTVVGVSLLGECRMRLREFPDNEATGQTGKKRSKSVVQVLEPRSAYVLQGPARSLWQHSIPSTESLRYSITFRTLRAGGKRKGG